MQQLISATHGVGKIFIYFDKTGTFQLGHKQNTKTSFKFPTPKTVVIGTEWNKLLL